MITGARLITGTDARLRLRAFRISSNKGEKATVHWQTMDGRHVEAATPSGRTAQRWLFIRDSVERSHRPGGRRAGVWGYDIAFRKSKTLPVGLLISVRPSPDQRPRIQLSCVSVVPALNAVGELTNFSAIDEVTTIGFHASHEQFPPGELLACVRLAEAAGFERITASDHFHPWNEAQGQSGFVWSWLGAAMAVTSEQLGYLTVSAPGWRLSGCARTGRC